MANPHLLTAQRLHTSGNLAEAARLYQQVLKGEPRNVAALCALALLHFHSRQFEEAEKLFARAVAVQPRAPEALCFRGVALLELKRTPEALAAFDAAVAVNPRFADALVNRATALLELGRTEEALAGFEQALTVQPRHAHAWNNRGNAFLALDRFTDAVASYDRALTLEPGLAQAWYNRANALMHLRRHAEAVVGYDKAIALNANYGEAWFQRGHGLGALGKHNGALISYDRALNMLPGSAALIAARANTLFALGRLDEAVTACESAGAIDPDFPYLRGDAAYWRLVACDWRYFENDTSDLAAGIAAGKTIVGPFACAVMSDSAERQLRAAEIWAARELPKVAPLYKGEAYRHEKIRLAYISADFREHATAQLIAGLFEQHDRTRFDLTALSLKRDEESPFRARIARGFDRFIDADRMTDAEAAKTLRALEIDIAIDLKGVTTDARPAILAYRPAPVQASYLGFPATMGSPHIDYLIADRVVIPSEMERHFSECLVFLPHCYQVNDSAREMLSPSTRADAGLPEQGFVFCAFNNSYKITPAMFDVWMRLLKEVPDSVLWLIAFNPPMARNLKREAEARGVEPARLVFAPFLPSGKHLARFAAADLFLDTLPCNAHTTASEALWAGVPVLTLPGLTFAGRVCASVVRAMDLEDLIVGSLAEYEALALKLAREPQLLAEMKTRVAANRATSALFDTARFARTIEAAYTTMWERHQNGLPPVSFGVGEHGVSY